MMLEANISVRVQASAQTVQGKDIRIYNFLFWTFLFRFWRKPWPFQLRPSTINHQTNWQRKGAKNALNLQLDTFRNWLSFKPSCERVFCKISAMSCPRLQIIVRIININLQQLSLANMVRRRETFCFTRLNTFCFPNFAKFPFNF